MNYRSVWIPAMACLFSFNYPRDSERRLLAVGGIHIFERQQPCRLIRAEPESAVEDLAWTGTLALEAKSEGTAEVSCDSDRVLLEIVAPVRFEIEIITDRKPTDIVVHERFKVQARLYDRQGRELEVGKLTIFEWSSSEILVIANDRSSGEFGFCDTCFGMYSFRAIRPGKGSILARLGSLQGMLTVVVNP